MRTLLALSLLALAACPGGKSAGPTAGPVSSGGPGAKAGPSEADDLAAADALYEEALQLPLRSAERVPAYAKAAAAYKKVIERYPSSGKRTKTTLRLANVLYEGDQFEEAAATFRLVRDKGDPALGLREEAAKNAAIAQSAAIDAARADGTLVEPPLPTPAAIKAGKPIPLAPAYRDFVADCDAYASRGEDAGKRAAMTLNAGVVHLRHLQLDEAAQRFQRVITDHCEAPESVNAKDNLLQIHRGRGDDAKFSATNREFLDRGCGGKKAAAASENVAKQELGIRFETAQRLQKEGKLAEAGEKFLELGRLIPGDDPHRFDAFASGCFALDKAKKTDAAIDAYREFLALAGADGSEYYPEMLMRLAVLLQDKGAVDEAVMTFLRLAEIAAAADRPVRKTFDLKKARTDALWNAALLREKAGVFADVSRREPGAATIFARFAQATTEGNRAVEALTRSAVAAGKGGDLKGMSKTLAEARKKFSAEAYATVFIFLGYAEEAKAYEAAGKADDAERIRRETLKAFEESPNAKPGTPAAVYVAEARFWLAEKAYKERFEPYKIEWKGKVDQAAMTKAVDAWQKVITEAQAEFNDVVRYKTPWNIAAAVRFGDVCYHGAQKLLEAPAPKELEELDLKDPKAGAVKQYRAQAAELVAQSKLLDSAREAWKQAAAATPPNEWSAQAKGRLDLLKK